MAGHGTKLGRKREDAIAGLLSQRNVDEAARAAGVGARTLWRWLQDPEFQAANREARRAALGQAIARLQQGVSAAATTLLKTMIDPNTPASVRVRAAECVMNHATKANRNRRHRGSGVGVGARGPRRGRSLYHQESAVDFDDLSLNKARLLGAEEHDHVRNLFGGSQTSHRSCRPDAG